MQTKQETEKPQKIAIIGGGPIGLYLSLVLSREGYNVDVYEKRDEVRDESHAIGLAISARGIHALKQIDLDVTQLEIQKLYGRGVHNDKGEYHFHNYGRKDEYLCAIDRNYLHRILMQKIKEYSNVQLFSGLKINTVDFEGARLEVAGEMKEYHWIFGADGAFSPTREAMILQKGYSSSIQYGIFGYCEVKIKSSTLDRNALHYWPRHTFELFAVPDFKENQFTGDLFLPMTGDNSFEIVNKLNLVEFCKKNFPDVEVSLAERSADRDDTTTKIRAYQIPNISVYPWMRGKVCLIGDAAHAMEPFIGQGLNCGLEDCTTLIEIIQTHKAKSESINLKNICDELQKNRYQNVRQIQKIAKQTFIETSSKVADVSFIRRKQISHYLSEVYPDLFLSQYQLVSYTRVPYINAYKYKEFEQKILDETLGIPNIDNMAKKYERSIVIEQLLKRYLQFTSHLLKGTSADQSLNQEEKLLDKSEMVPGYMRERFIMPSDFGSNKEVFDSQNGQQNENPKNKTNIYLCGHSLGPQPKSTSDNIMKISQQWAIQGRPSWVKYWFPLDQIAIQKTCPLIGALPEEVTYSSTLTVNTHQMLSTFYDSTRNEKAIMMIDPEFSSDVYAAQSWLKLYNKSDKDLIFISVTDPSTANGHICETICSNKGNAQILLMSAVNYVTGQFYDIPRISQVCHENSITLILQLAHAIGAVPLELHNWEVDCAVWCTYKYLNSGPGCAGGIFVHNKHKDKQPGLMGWFGVKREEMFAMKKDLIPCDDTRKFQISGFDPYQLTRVISCLELYEEIGGIQIVKQLSDQLYDYTCSKIEKLNVKILSPRNSNEHGGHIALLIDKNYHQKLQELLDQEQITCDFRPFDDHSFILRAGLVGMYNTFVDCEKFIKAIEEIFT